MALYKEYTAIYREFPPLVTDSHLERLQGSLFDSLPFCSGVLSVAQNDLALYYGKGEDARRLEFRRSLPSGSLEHLVNACEPASFGRGNHNVYDESYRKAVKLGSDAFQPTLDVNSVGLMNLIHERLLGGAREQKKIRAELYNLNVYGEGSFFKAHVDTPRGEDMFGSLVVFYPTTHEGGALLMRKNGKEWSFDFPKLLSEKDDELQIGYVALYSDVEHEVLTVTSGHRITITYNLYFTDTTPGLPNPISSASGASEFKSTLKALLDDPYFLPWGGHLGFGLEYAYPSHTSAGRSLQSLETQLKGVDADMFDVLYDLSLKPRLWCVVDSTDPLGLVACRPTIPECGKFDGDWFMGWLYDKFDTKLLKTEYDYDHELNSEAELQVVWVKPVPEDHRKQQFFMGYGNEYHPDYAYHSVCLIAEIGKPGERITPLET